VKTAIVIGAASLALAAPAVAEANWGTWSIGRVNVGVHGVGWEQKHHWWQGPRQPRIAREIAWHTRWMRNGGDEHRVDVKRVVEGARCAELHVKYEVRHPLIKPLSLRGLEGCPLWRADAAYHSRRPSLDVGLPSVRTLLLGAEAAD
jgi:hypothetical protein